MAIDSDSGNDSGSDSSFDLRAEGFRCFQALLAAVQVGDSTCRTLALLVRKRKRGHRAQRAQPHGVDQMFGQNTAGKDQGARPE